MCLSELARLIETTDDPDAGDLPLRAAVEELVCQGQRDQLLLLFAAQEIRRFYARVLCWQELGRPGCAPLTPAELQVLQARGNSAAVCGIALPSYIAETYRAFCSWYAGIVR
jgi:hypothetical protein